MCVAALMTTSFMTQDSPHQRPPLFPSSTSTNDLHIANNSFSQPESKRVTAIRLYQEEKSRRLANTNINKTDLSSQYHKQACIDSLSNSSSSPSPPPSSIPCSTGTVFSISQLNNINTVEPVRAIPSLTWHCLAMTEVLARHAPPIADNNHNVESNSKLGVENEQRHRKEIEVLMEKLRWMEERVEKAKRVQGENERLITQLRTQLDESTAACQGLVELVKEQEDTIEKLS